MAGRTIYIRCMQCQIEDTQSGSFSFLDKIYKLRNKNNPAVDIEFEV